MAKKEGKVSNGELLKVIKTTKKELLENVKVTKKELLENARVTNEESMDAINESFTQVDGKFEKIDGRLTKIEAAMVTKDYLDEKLADLRGDLVVLTRKEDKKVRKLVDILEKHKVLSKKDVNEILCMDPFPELDLRLGTGA